MKLFSIGWYNEKGSFHSVDTMLSLSDFIILIGVEGTLQSDHKIIKRYRHPQKYRKSWNFISCP